MQNKICDVQIWIQISATLNTLFQRVLSADDLVHVLKYASITSNATGRHRGPKRKLRASYRTTSLKRTSCCEAFSSSRVVSRAFSALCVYSTSGHHPHPLSYRCSKFHFFRDPHCWASPWRKIAYSLIQLIWWPENRNRSYRFGINLNTKNCHS